MPKEVIITIILAIAQIPIAIVGGTMPQARSRVPPISSAVAAIVILILIMLYWADKVSQTHVLYGAIALTVITLVIAIVFIVKKRQAVNENSITKEIPYAKEWERYNKLRDLFLSLETVAGETRRKSLADIERERDLFDDAETQKAIDLFLNAEDERIGCGVPADQHFIRSILKIMRQRMNKKYKRR